MDALFSPVASDIVQRKMTRDDAASGILLANSFELLVLVEQGWVWIHYGQTSSSLGQVIWTKTRRTQEFLAVFVISCK